MAATKTITTTIKPPKPTARLVCFSFAAYAKTVIDHLQSLNIPILPGLTDHEFTSIETLFHFTFPPDLRSILQVGLPVGPHFPNWRSSSPQQLQILLNLPFLNLTKNISRNSFWADSWGQRPNDTLLLDAAKGVLAGAPVLVPIYKNCYIPSEPNAAGNPVFYVDDEVVRVISFDVTRFFREVEFLHVKNVTFLRNDDRVPIVNVPAWAATDARRVEFWTEVAERGRRPVAPGEMTAGWWNGGGWEEVQDCLEEVFWRLRDGGWKEEEVKDMMMMMDGRDREEEEEREEDGVEFDGGGGWDHWDVGWQVRVLSLVLLRAGWSKEDVAYSLDLQDDEDGNGPAPPHDHHQEGKFFLDYQVPNSCCFRDGDDHHQITTLNQLMNLQSLEV